MTNNPKKISSKYTQGYVEVVEILLNSEADANIATCHGVTPLYIATQNCHPQIVKLLVDHKVDVNKGLPTGKLY